MTVDVGSTTTYFDPGVSSPTLADVKVGEHVAVFGTESRGTVTATQVAIGNPPDGKGGPGGTGGGRPGGPGGAAGGPPTAVGTVKSVGAGTFTVAAHGRHHGDRRRREHDHLLRSGRQLAHPRRSEGWSARRRVRDRDLEAP